MAPLAGIVNSSSIVKIASGLPIVQPSTSCGAAGMSLSSPFGAPASTHFAIVSTSASDRRGSFLNVPCAGSAPHGGIVRAVTRCLMARAHGRASSKVINDIGANIVGRWHSTQLLYRIGATSLVKVTGASAAAAADGSPRSAASRRTFLMPAFYRKAEVGVAYFRTVG